MSDKLNYYEIELSNGRSTDHTKICSQNCVYLAVLLNLLVLWKGVMSWTDSQLYDLFVPYSHCENHKIPKKSINVPKLFPSRPSLLDAYYVQKARTKRCVSVVTMKIESEFGCVIMATLKKSYLRQSVKR